LRAAVFLPVWHPRSCINEYFGLDRQMQAKSGEEESTLISKTFRIARMIVLASFALSSAAWAATCSNASLSGTYGLLHGTAMDGTPTTAVSQLTFDSTTGTYVPFFRPYPHTRQRVAG
jgi:hypothetical protein